MHYIDKSHTKIIKLLDLRYIIYFNKNISDKSYIKSRVAKEPTTYETVSVPLISSDNSHVPTFKILDQSEQVKMLIFSSGSGHGPIFKILDLNGQFECCFLKWQWPMPTFKILDLSEHVIMLLFFQVTLAMCQLLRSKI